MPTLDAGRTTHDLVWTTAARVRGRRLRENVSKCTANCIARRATGSLAGVTDERNPPATRRSLTETRWATGQGRQEARSARACRANLSVQERPTGSNNDADESISSAQTRPTCSTYHEHDGDDNERNYRRMEPLGCTRLAASRWHGAGVSRIIDEDGKAIGRYGRGPARGHQ
ncbi:hypothetical protein BJ912DRAFT_1009498 [Pholiota molesta]|nr:hypothetical protein BJ912DRAFT_1009498 [Pholiota molesta]